MGNYKQIGPFVYGDPRFLAGGSRSTRISYSDVRTSVNDGRAIVPPADPKTSSYKAITGLGQSVSCGKSGYHGNSNANIFVTSDDLKYPTVGVEVETLMRVASSEYAQRFTKSVYSNWFHAESDGSLDRNHGGTYGYELVTTVLPARIYRDINVWTGFQNLISPLVYSYSTNETGLHVHVGMEWFENTKFPAASPEVVMLFGKILTAQIYYSFLPRTLAQRVFLRNSDLHYCHETSNWSLSRAMEPMSGHRLIDEATALMLSSVNYSDIESAWLNAIYPAMKRTDKSTLLNAVGNFGENLSSNGLNYGHDSEINASPRLTLEFRRGKGTTNALSIHRIIELCVLTVMYSGHVIDNPSEIVSSKNLLSFVIENTTSQALKALAEKEYSAIQQ